MDLYPLRRDCISSSSLDGSGARRGPCTAFPGESTLIGLTFTLAVAGIVTGFTLNAGSGEPAQDPDATSIDDIDPKVCNAIHNINACTPEELEDLGVAPHGDSTYDEWLSDFGDGKVVTSIDNVDPNACDYIHNINACTPEELEELGNLAAISWIVDPDTVVEGEPEPPFVDGEPVTMEVMERGSGAAISTRRLGRHDFLG